MREKTRKTILFMLALLLAAGMIPFNPVTAFAAVSVKNETALFNAVNKVVNSSDGDGDGIIKLTKDVDISKCLRIPAGRPVTIDLNGYMINRGLTECQDIGSVIRVEPGAVLTIKDSSNDNSGSITGGASWNGGGVCNHGTLTLEGGTISGNKSLHNTYGGGGGIYNGSYEGSKATLTLKGGVISYNEARNGGGIYNSDGEVIIKKGSYEVTELSQLKTYETNVRITDNSATVSGSGIYTERDIKIQDAPYISGNKNNEDIYLLTTKVLKLTGKLRKAAVIGIKTEDYDNIITSGYYTYQTEDPNEFFKPASSNAIIRMSDTKENGGEVKIKIGGKSLVEVYKSSNRSKRNASELYMRQEYDKPADAVWTAYSLLSSSAISNLRVELTLGSDYSFDGQINIPNNGYLVVDLNGHTIKRTRNGKKKDNGDIFLVKEGGTLTINDSNPTANSGNGDVKGGVITGGANSNGGGGITVEKNGNLFMNGGTIYQCSTDYDGGGICAKDGAKQIVLKKCSVVSCKTDDSWDDCDGGGIYAKNVSRLELENVTVKKCSSEDYGGGVYYYGGNNGIFIISACTFDNNLCGDDGGAVYYSSSEGGYFDKTTFTSNRANDDGGCIYAVKNGQPVYSKKAEEPVMIRECTMKNNSCGDEGSAVFVDRNDVVFVTDTITDNTADDKGAVYVSHNAGSYGYDISLKGLMVIKDNKSDTAGRSNIVLENYGATHNYIYSAGLYEGSYVSFSVLESGKVKVIRNVNSYQLNYYHPEKGTLSFAGEKTVDATLVTASVFNNGSLVAIIAILGVAAAGIVAAVIYKKKKGAVKNDDDE